VRFLLSNESTMTSTRQSHQPRPVREKQIVLPTTEKEEEKKFGTASSWNRNQLKDLGVNFVPSANRIDLNKRVLKVKESEWPPELRTRNNNSPVYHWC
jgi:hypothetical protein